MTVKFEELERHLTIPKNFDGDTTLTVNLSHLINNSYMYLIGYDSIAIFQSS